MSTTAIEDIKKNQRYFSYTLYADFLTISNQIKPFLPKLTLMFQNYLILSIKNKIKTILHPQAFPILLISQTFRIKFKHVCFSTLLFPIFVYFQLFKLKFKHFCFFTPPFPILLISNLVN